MADSVCQSVSRKLAQIALSPTPTGDHGVITVVRRASGKPGNGDYLSERIPARSRIDNERGRACYISLRPEITSVSAFSAGEESMSTLAVTEHTAAVLVPLAEEAVALIDRSYADPRLSPGTLADRLFISRRQLYRALEEVATSPALAIGLRRTIAAAELLALHPDLPRSEVARRCGFSSTTALRRHLDRHTAEASNC